MIKPNYSKALNKACGHLYVSKTLMAEGIGLSKNHYCLLCNGTKKPSLGVLELAAEACDVPLSTLIRWGEE